MTPRTEGERERWEIVAMGLHLDGEEVALVKPHCGAKILAALREVEGTRVEGWVPRDENHRANLTHDGHTMLYAEGGNDMRRATLILHNTEKGRDEG